MDLSKPVPFELVFIITGVVSIIILIAFGILKYIGRKK